MVNPDLLTYIKSERQKGIPDSTIKVNIASQGWNSADFNEAVSVLSGTPTSKIVSPELRQYRKNRKWLIFWLLLILPGIFLISTIQGTLLSSSGILGMLSLYIISFGIAAYISSAFVTSTIKPSLKSWQEILKVIGLTIVASVLFVMIGGVIFFVTCIFVLSTGGLSGL